MEKLNTKLLVDYLYEYSRICKQQQEVIRRMQCYLQSVNNTNSTNGTVDVSALQAEIELLRHELQMANEDKYKSCQAIEELGDQIEILLERIDGLERYKNSLMINGQRQKISKELFLEAYEFNKDLDSLADLFNVQTQTIRNYIKRYVKE